MIDHHLAEKLDAAWGDPRTWVAEGLQWMHLPAVQQAVHRRVSGEPGLDNLHWFLRHAAAAGSGPFGRVLVLGCGLKQIERTLVREGHAAEAVAIDLSAQVVERSRADRDRPLSVHYLQADMNALPLGDAGFRRGSFDAVIGVSSVHHCARLDALYASLHALLAPGGWLFLDEYIGPERFQYSRAHMDFLNAVADTLPDRLLTTRSGQLRRGFRSPTVEEVVAVDPTEAVNSTRIVPALHPRFRIEALKPYGGSLLQLLLAGVAQNFMGDEQPHLQALIRAEDEALRSGQLEHHFACVIARAQ